VISRVADLLTKGQQHDHLPRPEPESFEGNLLRFPLWIKSFENLIESRTTTPSEMLFYLGRYMKGEAREVIEGVLPLTTDAYLKAKALLHESFINPFLISDAYRKKINDWPKIQANNGPALPTFADFLKTWRTATAEIKYQKVLDDPDENPFNSFAAAAIVTSTTVNSQARPLLSEPKMHAWYAMENMTMTSVKTS